MSLTDRAHSLGFSCVKGMFVFFFFFFLIFKISCFCGTKHHTPPFCLLLGRLNFRLHFIYSPLMPTWSKHLSLLLQAFQ